MIVAALVCLGVMTLFSLKGQMVSYLAVMEAYTFGVAFLSTVVIRLPVFKQYYKNDQQSLEIKIPSLAEQKAAPVMSSIVTSVTFGAIVYLTDISNPGVSVLCSGITAGVMSHYHETHF